MPVRCAHPDCQRWPFQHGLCKAHKGYTPGQEGDALAPVDAGAEASAATKAPASAPPPTGKADESRSAKQHGKAGAEQRKLFVLCGICLLHPRKNTSDVLGSTDLARGQAG